MPMPDLTLPTTYAAQFVYSPATPSPFAPPPPPPRPRPSVGQMYTGLPPPPPEKKMKAFTLVTANGPMPFEPDSVTEYYVRDETVHEC